jgi:TPR repeat protein
MKRLFCSLLLSFFAVCASGSKDLDCYNWSLSIQNILKSCKSIVNDATFGTTDQARAAKQAGRLLKVIDGDHREIIGFFLVAIGKGDVAANSDIGELYRLGYKGVMINYEKALYYYKLDTTMNPIKVRAMGEMEVEGQGMERNLPSGIESIKFAAMLSGRYSLTASKLCSVYSEPKYQFIRIKMAYYWCTLQFMEEDSPRLKAYYYEIKNKIGMSLSAEDKQRIEYKLKTCERPLLTVCDMSFSVE